MEISAQLIDWVRSLYIFKRNKKPMELKVKAFLLWLMLSSCRKASRLLELWESLPASLALMNGAEV